MANYSLSLPPPATKKRSPNWSADIPTVGHGTEAFQAVVQVPRDNPHGSVVLRGARLITMRGDEVIENGDVDH